MQKNALEKRSATKKLAKNDRDAKRDAKRYRQTTAKYICFNILIMPQFRQKNWKSTLKLLYLCEYLSIFLEVFVDDS